MRESGEEGARGGEEELGRSGGEGGAGSWEEGGGGEMDWNWEWICSVKCVGVISRPR